MKAKFTKWFNAKRFNFFTADEFASYFEVTRRGVANSYPPESKWNNIIEPLRIIDSLRDHFGKPCVILSSYRNKEYNHHCGGAKNSRHLEFDALDIAFVGITPKQVYDKLLEWRRAGRFKGGLGLYPTFVHIDNRGYNNTW